MPAPSTIVYITDADGDEFPIRLWGHQEDSIITHQRALKELKGYVDRGEMKPTFPVHVPRVEQID